MKNEMTKAWNNLWAWKVNRYRRKALGKGRGRHGNRKDDKELGRKEEWGDIHRVRGRRSMGVYIE